MRGKEGRRGEERKGEETDEVKGGEGNGVRKGGDVRERTDGIGGEREERGRKK